MRRHNALNSPLGYASRGRGRTLKGAFEDTQRSLGAVPCMLWRVEITHRSRTQGWPAADSFLCWAGRQLGASSASGTPKPFAAACRADVALNSRESEVGKGEGKEGAWKWKLKHYLWNFRDSVEFKRNRRPVIWHVQYSVHHAERVVCAG